ncbi:CRP-like cAMP-binding protein [Paraburkholderia sp. BL23I1N1]|uniref:Crp/Fnr family transcriptional regulator n=1 Tax=Paraburkholderia sp. BL23I1N1 TaxID=1938802 RepID=UPI000FEF25AC|nr:Crp/Fnr family transcriptional regulator [Paraburkholderia sp. BL23I1N1]RKE39901.1 CRP-like cAMP-binding protein [Paraburkholderia sp. BL23I1N1]
MASIKDTSEEMRANTWFGSLPAAEQDALLSSSELITLQPGNYVFRQGDVPNGFYGVNQGRVKAFTVREDGKEAILAVLQAGNWFGQTSLFQRTPRMRDVAAIEETTIFVVKPPAFEELMKSTGFVRAIADLQSIHMNWLYRMVEDATLHSTRAKIARRLMFLAYGDVAMAPQMSQEISVSQDTLAMMLGITRQTLGLELKAMAAKGAISLRYGRIEILSKEILQKFTEYL